MPEEVVYVLGTPGSNTVKIGRTTNLAKRVADIQRMSPVPLTVLWSTPGGHQLETQLHRHFADLRSHGEWFTFRVNAVPLIQWATEDEPWLRPKVKLTKTKTKAKKEATIPPSRSPAKLDVKLTPALEKRIEDLGRALAGISDPIERYEKASQSAANFRREFSQMRQEIALNLKREGRSWREVGEILGVTGSRAEQMSRCAR
jgi:hypothetical protein